MKNTSLCHFFSFRSQSWNQFCMEWVMQGRRGKILLWNLVELSSADKPPFGYSPTLNDITVTVWLTQTGKQPMSRAAGISYTVARQILIYMQMSLSAIQTASHLWFLAVLHFYPLLCNRFGYLKTCNGLKDQYMRAIYFLKVSKSLKCLVGYNVAKGRLD